jgi:hypothetical protein
MSGGAYTDAGPGFTVRDITSIADLAEDRIVSTAGSYTETAPMDRVNAWVLQVAAFH